MIIITLIFITSLVLYSFNELICGKFKIHKEKQDIIDFFSGAISFVLGILLLIYSIFIFVNYAQNSAKINEIDLDYDSLCVMFIQEKGHTVITENMRTLKQLKAENDSWFYDYMVPDRVDESYSKYKKSEDEVFLMNFDGICKK